ncbi:helix-turn-helix domain-containing protein [Brevibacterium casei]|uniref:helix-turn-helix domain-containing protein n=1 Tax=Brevibacterium casei TaxID=33889 RepID=UPI001CBA6865|nr:helix-turn-helix domain-containing protein [Brevibacterium casei]
MSLFYRHGIHAVGVEAIAAEAGVTKRTGSGRKISSSASASRPATKPGGGDWSNGSRRPSIPVCWRCSMLTSTIHCPPIAAAASSTPPPNSPPTIRPSQ